MILLQPADYYYTAVQCLSSRISEPSMRQIPCGWIWSSFFGMPRRAEN